LTYKILLVSDRIPDQSLPTATLQQAGFDLTPVSNIKAAFESLHQETFDLVLLNPATAGEILRYLTLTFTQQAQGQHRQLLLQKIDSFLCELKEIDGLDSRPLSESQNLTFENGLVVDLLRREMRLDHISVVLTPTEGRLVKVLLDHRGQTLTHRELILLVQGYEATDWEAAEALRPLVSRLRHKLAVFPQHKIWISSVRGTGYFLDLSA
jgi:DNA-binding response OmpR family regulator